MFYDKVVQHDITMPLERKTDISSIRLRGLSQVIIPLMAAPERSQRRNGGRRSSQPPKAM